MQKIYVKIMEILQVLKNIHLKIEDGDIYGLVGKSGVGKSTLLRCINGLETYQSGSLQVEGEEVSKKNGKALRLFRKQIGMVFQHFSLLERKSVRDNIALPMKCWGISGKESEKEVERLAKIVGLEDKTGCESAKFIWWTKTESCNSKSTDIKA